MFLVQRVIFPVVCLLGSEHQLVCSSACEAALSIARATGHWSVQSDTVNNTVLWVPGQFKTSLLIVMTIS